ncbi:molybdopterin-dependent oxidoreductase [Halomicroarcula sp. S1AR25-4]|uniref:assimilatory nitrate reductase NasA n=1 Tax=Haloarcula sp. S1AR25-4 TaxID=2950538 RepID=UPI00287559F4|nr:assimilatory nitrate reductase NasA [Halomicroarcula sp. S1AR25-4]MDS0278897.1 molybdopterin-dependent oxidoreductase [Halomicroarcula sp. S1AR25-4]
MSDWVPTTCMRCAVGCGHMHRAADVGYGIDTVRGDAAHPVNQGLACARGIQESRDPDGQWLTRPMVRDDGELRQTTWDVALARAVEGLREAHETDPDSVAVLGSGQQTNEAAYALGKVARGGFGTRLYDANTTLCMASAVTAYYQAFGSDAPPCTYADIEDADRHVVWGANPAVAHPVMFRWIRQAADAEGVELLTVDPIRSETAENSDHHVAPDPGKDLALARAVLARLVETDRVDEAFVAEATDGFDELLAALPTAAEAADEAGVEMAEVDLLADAMDRRALLYWGMGINQHVQGTETARALVDLALASGNLRPGGGPFSLTGQANSMGTRVCSSKGSWPGQRAFGDPDHRRLVADAWDVPVDRLPDDPGPGPVGMLETEPEAVWAVATNPVAGMPDADSARETLEDTFLVAQDAFHTETTRLADVVLPAATWGESDGTTTNMERTISRVRAATEVPSGVRQDLDIVATIGSRLFPALFDATSPDPSDVFDEFAALTEGTVADCSGITYDRLDEAHAVRWPAPDEESAGGYRYYETEAGGAESWAFPTASGNAQFSTGRQGDLPEPTDDDYPLTLTTAREADGYNTGVRSRGGAAGDLVARLHPETVAAHADRVVDDRLTVTSRRGSATVLVDEDEGVPRGMVWLPIHHPATNRLTLSERDPQSKEPHFKQCAVRLVAPEASDATDMVVEADD